MACAAGFAGRWPFPGRVGAAACLGGGVSVRRRFAGGAFELDAIPDAGSFALTGAYLIAMLKGSPKITHTLTCSHG